MSLSIFNFNDNIKNIKHIACFRKILLVLFGLLYFSLVCFIVKNGITRYKVLLFLICALVTIAFYIKNYRLILKIIVFSAVLFLIIGELYFRVHYFGLDGIKNFHLYVPAGIGSPLSNLQYDENSSYTGLKPETHGVFKGAHFYVNNYGFRDSNWDFNESKIKIAIFGTSISMGAGVSQGENYSDQLEEMLNLGNNIQDKKFEIFNFSIGGYGMDDILDVIDKYEIELAPDVFIIEAYGFKKKGLHKKKKFKGTKKNLLDFALKKPYRISFFLQVIRDEFLYNIKGRLFTLYMQKSNIESESEDLKEYYFKEIKRRLKNKKVYILALKGIRKLKNKSKVDNKIKMLCRKYGFELIDTYKEDFGDNDMEMIIYPGDRHPNKYAHKIYAESIYKSLKSYDFSAE